MDPHCRVHDVRILLGLGLVIVGGYLAIHAWLPTSFQASLPALIANWALAIGCVLTACGLLLLRPAPRRPAFGDGPLVTTLTQAGFRTAANPDGWQAHGQWKGVALTVRRSNGHHAGRFGRPWTIVVALPGRPAEPWPFMPEEGLIIDRRPDGFSVAMADLSRPERMHRLGERLDQLIAQRG